MLRHNSRPDAAQARTPPFPNEHILGSLARPCMFIQRNTAIASGRLNRSQTPRPGLRWGLDSQKEGVWPAADTGHALQCACKSLVGQGLHTFIASNNSEGGDTGDADVGQHDSWVDVSPFGRSAARASCAQRPVQHRARMLLSSCRVMTDRAVHALKPTSALQNGYLDQEKRHVERQPSQ